MNNVDMAEQEIALLELKIMELESSLALLKEQYEECFMDYRKCGRERGILLEAVEAIKKHQEIALPLDDRMRALSTTWFISDKALEKIKEN